MQIFWFIIIEYKLPFKLSIIVKYYISNISNHPVYIWCTLIYNN